MWVWGQSGDGTFAALVDRASVVNLPDVALAVFNGCLAEPIDVIGIKTIPHGQALLKAVATATGEIQSAMPSLSAGKMGSAGEGIKRFLPDSVQSGSNPVKDWPKSG